MTLDKKLNDAFEEMMKYRQSIGYATATYRSSVPPFINFCVKNYPLSARITQEMVDEWLTYYPYTVNSKAAFISLLREYTKYLNFLGYDDYIPDDDYVVKRIAFNPYLFTDDELFGLFKTIDSYVGKTCGKRYLPEVVLPVYSRLLYCCGLRPQEPPAIRTEDVDLVTGKGILRVTAGGGFVATVRGKVSVDISLAQIAVDYKGAAVSAVEAIGTAIVTSGASLLAGGLSGISNAIDSTIPQVRSSGSNGSMADFIYIPQLECQFFEIAAEDNERLGRPLCERRKINTLSGYLQTVDTELQIPATSGEIDMIKSYMEGGMHFD